MEGGIRVPTIASFMNGENRENEETSVPTSQLDLFPTLAELIDSKIEDLDNGLDGESFLDLMKKSDEPKKTDHERYFFHYCGSYLHGIRYLKDENNIFKIYYYKPKFISKNEYRCEFVCRCYGEYVNQLDPPEIYNLATDPYEDSPIDKLQPLYTELINKFNQAKTNHTKTIKSKVDHQLIFSKIIFNPLIQPCCGTWCSCKEFKD